MKLKNIILCVGIVLSPLFLTQLAQAQQCSKELEDKNHVFTKKHLALLTEWYNMKGGRYSEANRTKNCVRERKSVVNYRDHIRFLKGEGSCVGMARRVRSDGSVDAETGLEKAEKALAEAVDDVKTYCKS
jgi:hypothetical protein